MTAQPTETPTPRCDAWAVPWTDVKSDTWYVPRIHARTLERELSAAMAAIADAKELSDLAIQYASGCPQTPWPVVRDALARWVESHDAAIQKENNEH
jgi:hypothetical protein